MVAFFHRNQFSIWFFNNIKNIQSFNDMYVQKFVSAGLTLILRVLLFEK